MRAALVTRNNIAHALPVKDGLHRRVAQDLHYVRNFFSVEDVAAAALELEQAWQEGSRVLFHDGGASVSAWYAAGGRWRPRPGTRAIVKFPHARLPAFGG